MSSSLARRLTGAALLASVGAVAACDLLPSEAPILQQTWVVPGDSVTVGVSQILPAGVNLNGAGTAFVLSTPSANVSTTLGALCGLPVCTSTTTANVPVPAFTSGAGTLSSTIAIPAGVTAATVTGGNVVVAIANNLGFDPLRPNGATTPYGRLIVTRSSGTATRTDTIGGLTQAMPSGATTTLTLALPTGTWANSLTFSLVFDVPAGANATLNANNSLSISASLQTLTVSGATVVVNNDAVNTAPSAFNLEDVDFADQVESGGFIIDVQNPFTASAALNMVITAPAQNGQAAVSITKPLTITAQPTSTTSVDLTKAELQSLVGKANVTIAVNGTATGTGAGNTVTVTPTQKITMRTKVRLVLNVGA
jgi:hypothetical protein